MIRDNWDFHLVRFAKSIRGKPYVWGETDCASIVLRSLEAVHVESPLSGVGSWTTKTGALRALKRESPEITLRAAGAREITRPYASGGDTVLWPPSGSSDGIPQLGVVVPVGWVVTSYDDIGVVQMKITDVEDGATFWRHDGR
jgi:hypothetical protein